MIYRDNVKLYCSEYEQIENYQEAISSPERWDCHHRRETDEGFSRKELIKLDLYYHRPPEELIFLSRQEHLSIHKKGNKNMLGKKHSNESKKKMSESQRGDKGYWHGKHLSEEHRKKISIKLKDRVGDKNPHYKSICPALLAMMKYMQKMTYAKISSQLGISTDTINRKLNKLK